MVGTFEGLPEGMWLKLSTEWFRISYVGGDGNDVVLTNLLPFDPVSAGLPDIDKASLAWGDYDGDGDLDLLLVGSDASSNGVADVYRNDGGSFNATDAGLPGVYAGSVAWGDYDNDGQLDILLTGTSSAVAEVYHNEGGAFTAVGAGLTGVTLGSAAWADYDNDGDLDILLTGRDAASEAVSEVYRNDAGSFTEDTNIDLVDVDRSSVAWGDYDNDSRLDILLTGYSSTGPVTRVFHNEGGSFQEAATLPGVYAGSAVWGDYDSDGDLDILLTGSTSTGCVSRIYTNDTGMFSYSFELPGVANGNAAWGDYDNDGDLDALLTRGENRRIAGYGDLSQHGRLVQRARRQPGRTSVQYGRVGRLRPRRSTGLRRRRTDQQRWRVYASLPQQLRHREHRPESTMGSEHDGLLADVGHVELESRFRCGDASRRPNLQRASRHDASRKRDHVCRCLTSGQRWPKYLLDPGRTDPRRNLLLERASDRQRFDAFIVCG